MGNCQAIDNASFVLQTQNGRAERFYAPVSAAEMMKLHPGHHVALLLTTTTFYSTPPSSTSSNHQRHHRHPNNKNDNNNTTTNNNQPLRVTRIKLLRPTDNLVLGHAYRLITTQEVMKGIKAKKNGKLNNNNNNKNYHQQSESNSDDCDQASAIKSFNQPGKTHHQMRRVDKDRPVVNSKSTGNKPRGWHPSLNSISETTS